MKVAVLKALLAALAVLSLVGLGALYLTKIPNSGDVMELKAYTTDNGPAFHAENHRSEVEVRYVSSLLHTPEVTVKQKNSWLVFLLSVATGVLSGLITFHFMLKKARAKLTARAEENVVVKDENLTSL